MELDLTIEEGGCSNKALDDQIEQAFGHKEKIGKKDVWEYIKTLIEYDTMDKEDKRRLKSQFRNEYPIFLRKDKDGDGVDKATFRFILKDLGDL